MVAAPPQSPPTQDTAPAAEEAAAPVAAAPPPPAPPPSPAPPPPVVMAPALPRLIERRKVKRDPLSATALIRIDGVHAPPMRVALTDISVAGARFRSAAPMDAGGKAQIRLEVGPLRWTTRLRVVYCGQDDDGIHTVGCAFLRTELLRPWPATAA